MVIYAEVEEGETVVIQVADLDTFIHAAPDAEVFVTTTDTNSQTRCRKGDLRNMRYVAEELI